MFLLTNGVTGDFSCGYDLAVGIATMSSIGVSTKIDSGLWKRLLLYVVFMCPVIIGFYYVFNMYYGGVFWV